MKIANTIHFRMIAKYQKCNFSRQIHLQVKKVNTFMVALQVTKNMRTNNRIYLHVRMRTNRHVYISLNILCARGIYIYTIYNYIIYICVCVCVCVICWVWLWYKPCACVPPFSGASSSSALVGRDDSAIFLGGISESKQANGSKWALLTYQLAF